MIEVKIDEKEIKKIFLEEIEKHIKKIENETLFWDTDDLMKNTKMCWNTIQEKFFFDPRFPKRKVGRRWMFPAEKTKKFLLEWIDEQPNH
ncbi:group-specific protein [Alkalicoccobacillus murimartini]|uniref:Phage pi2 protein 07 n=1 Tax=Alkalicoccobacillus murimartini TaxID=171685 RepID=A0ABT9YM30_9BACI|nr:group-specific protein [Alkalicoccobacillus murimartini]MDQ0208930.1 phage pi2 protein 07 [Alkalicoccobacillus murimartini]